MKDLITKIKDFKIVPDKFRSSTTFNVKELFDDGFEIELLKLTEEELKDYVVGGNVEIFGSGKEGLIYFVTDITNKNWNILTIKYPESFKDIQRREYSRVSFGGNIVFADMPEVETKSVDISAGGLKFISAKKLEVGHGYDIVLNLNNKLEIKCAVEPIRVKEHDENGREMYLVSSKFLNIESVDRIALIQYTFRILLESENKG